MSIKETIPFNFDEIYDYIETKFADKGYDTQEGSNSMQLVTAMSYLVSMLNANTAVNINETLLPLARKRDTALQDARVLGYEIDHIRSFQYKLDVELSNDTLNPVNKTIQKYTKFSTPDYDYYYMGEDITVSVPAQSTETVSIIVIEGDLKRFDDNPDTLVKTIDEVTDLQGNTTVQYYIDVPFTNVEETGLEVYLTYNDEFGISHVQEFWTRSNSFMIDKDTILDKEYVRLDNIEFKTPRIYFKLGDVGKELRVNTLVEINALISSGENGKMTQLPTTDIDATVTNYTLEIQGSAEEDLESIKINAPLFHNTANRVITIPDYIAFCNRLAKVKDTDVWDGHTEVPIQKGHIWMSFLSNNIDRTIVSNDSNTNIQYDMQNISDRANWYLDQGSVPGSLDQDIQEAFDYLDGFKVPTLIFHHRNPAYFDFTFDVNIVKYVGAISKAEQNDLVFKVIDNYFTGFDENGNRTIETPVESYSYEFFLSNLNKRIDTELTDLMGFNINLSTSIYLNELNIINDEIGSQFDGNGTPTDYYNEIRFHLGQQYEDLLDINEDIITDNLPDISTTNFVGLDNLYVDYSTETYDNTHKMTTYSIRLGTGSSDTPNAGDDIIGEYRVYTGKANDIEVILYVISPNGYTTGLDSADVSNELEVNVKYPSPNIRFSRNTIPRLRQVNFT